MRYLFELKRRYEIIRDRMKNSLSLLQTRQWAATHLVLRCTKVITPALGMLKTILLPNLRNLFVELRAKVTNLRSTGDLRTLID